jgi:8-oxo-dGTP diphosphatase
MSSELELACTVARVEVGVLATCVQAAYRLLPDPCGLLLADTFTLLDLQRVHEAVLGETLMKDSFRRLMEPQLRATGELTSGSVGKPARLFSKIK